MIYNDDYNEDVINILQYINDFTFTVGIGRVQVESNLVVEVCLKMRQEFPHLDGLESSSTFKKVANFVAWFIDCGPIKSAFPQGSIKSLTKSYNPNAVVAFDIALICIENSIINSCDGEKKVNRSIYLSDHSYGDIIDALSQGGLTASSHYHLLAVFFEQLTYKTNRHCEYGPSGGGGGSTYYPPMPTDGDDMAGL